MVKIIKNNMQEPTNITCPGCQSELEFTHEDIQRDENKDLFMTWRRPPIRYIVCPVCKRDVLIEKVEVKFE